MALDLKKWNEWSVERRENFLTRDSGQKIFRWTLIGLAF